jgi:hypothetical protein
MKDNGILGALMLYQDDRDFEGLKARVIHKLLTPSSSREKPFEEKSRSRNPHFTYPSTALGGSRPHRQQDKYQVCIANLEQKNLLDPQTSQFVKMLAQERNVDTISMIN